MRSDRPDAKADDIPKAMMTPTTPPNQFWPDAERRCETSKTKPIRERSQFPNEAIGVEKGQSPNEANCFIFHSEPDWWSMVAEPIRARTGLTVRIRRGDENEPEPDPKGDANSPKRSQSPRPRPIPERSQLLRFSLRPRLVVNGCGTDQHQDRAHRQDWTMR